MKFIKAVAAVFLGSASLAAGENILEVATSNGFDTLVSAISAAGLVDELSGEGPFTVFAPSEDAFAALPSGALQYLLRSPDKLRAVLLDHVVDGDVLSSALNDGQVLVTLADASLFVSIDGSEVMINDATVVGADNIALNGVIHVIDTVLIQDSFYFPPTIVGIATGDAAFTTLATALQAANLEATLSGEGPFTLLAPSDGAFAKLPSGTLQFLLRNTDILTTILSYHVIDEYVRYSDIGYGTGTTVLPTLADASVTFYHDGVPGTGTTINNYDAAFVDVDNVAVNGVIHTIDHVLIPEGLTITPSIVDFVTDKSAFLNLAQFLGATGLIETLRGAGPFTVFAPTNDAFTQVPDALQYYLSQDDNVETLKEILTYHVVGDAFLKTNLSKGLVATLLDDSSLTISVMGESIEVNDVTVTSADMVVSNGVILSIDEVLFPSSLNLPTLIDVASADSDFATLIVAVAAAELVDDLSAPGPFTLFAPNEAGFGLLPDGTVQTLTEDEDKAPLRDILLYHVVEGLVRTEDILEEGLASAPTMQGANLTFSVMDDGTIVVDGTPVLGTVITANGIVHVIGAVLTPPVEATMAPVETTMAPTTAPIPTMAPISAYGEKDRAWATSTFVAALVSVAALLMV